MMESELADVDALLEEIARDLPDRKWSLRGDAVSAEARLEAPGFDPVFSYSGRMGADMPAIVLQGAVQSAKKAVARRDEPRIADIHLFSHEKRTRT